MATLNGLKGFYTEISDCCIFEYGSYFCAQIMQNLKVGVIGSGGRGVIDFHAHNPCMGSRVVTRCDINPATLTEACDRVLRAALESKTRLYLGHNMRHMPFVRKMKELIDAGAIGQVKTAWCRHFVGNGGDYYFKDWHAQREYSNGLLLQKGAHDIDVLHWFCGGYTQRVNALYSLMIYGDVKDRAAVKAVPTKPDSNVSEDFQGNSCPRRSERDGFR